MSTDPLKTQICDALAAFIRQRPGLEFGDYGDVAAYRSKQRSIARDKRDAETLLQAVKWREGITAEALQEAFKHAFNGRLKLTVTEHDYTIQQGPEVPRSTGWDVKIDYTIGQYWPTEYRKAAAAVCVSVLWAHACDAADGFAAGFKAQSGRELSADELRQHFRKEFGSKIQRRWFN